MKEDENEEYEMLDDGTVGDEGNEKAGHSAYVVPKDKKLHLSGMYQNWFIDYASYVILERAVPHIEDGLKPVQRRILHAMKELDDGRFNKVANLVGSTMQYHPHGDASIYGALVTLGQKGLLIDTQGNWGNVLTGDQAAAPRYIEARLSHFALETVFSPKVTEWTKSYDGRKDEPITLPAKFPLLLIYGSEGIAVGLSCKILPHNFNEVCDAAVSYLKNEEFQLYPDFQTTGGYVDVSHYNDGERGGSVRIRSKIDKRDNKTLVITDLPYGKTGTALKESILKAAEKNKIKIRSVVDYTAEQAEIVVTLQPGVSSDKTIDALYAFTDCEVSLSPNCCVIKDHKPQFLTVSDVLRYSVDRTMEIFRKELEIQRNETLESLHFASLEKIFIEERIYKDKGFENAPNMDAAVAHIDSRLEPFKPQFYREVTTDDILRLMEIKMARILKFNTDKADNYIATLNERIKEIDYKLSHMVEHTIAWFEHLKQKYGEKFPRNTQIRNFDTIVASKVVEANEKLYINREEGFIGTNLKKDEYVCNCSDIDDIIIFYKDGRFKVVKVAEKLYVGKNVLYLNVFKRNDERTIYNVLYQDGRGGAIYMKRFAVTGVTRDKEYNLTQGKPGSKIMWFTANANGEAETLRITLKPKQRMKILQFDVDLANLGVKGKLAKGNLVTKAEVHRISLKEKGVSTLGGREVWFDPDVLRINYDGRGTLLGEFFNDERILVIMNNGDFYTTTYDAENHYEEGILRIEKYREGVVWTAVLNDADQGFTYIKRFTLESNAKKQRMIGDNPKSELLLLTDERYPRFEVKFGGADSFREPMIIDAEEYIGVKSFKAKGKRVSNWAIESITAIEPREVPEEEAETPQVAAIDDDVVDTESVGADDVIDQGAVRDSLTGQMRIFDDADDEE
ncbi:MAG: DNA gyrase/topoisomerase IV subunit A [bacterium]|nr:DNA gyrase/topoisomerase IV subunit A [bacterium]MDD6027115.1 DNA gyrase/topoisomerase IV subunit A [bacterium]